MSELALNPSLLIYLIRHGETQYNRQNRFNGRTDSPLTEIGVSEAHRQGRVLSEVIEAGNTLRIKPPMCITKDDADYLIAMLDEVLGEIEK